jgi:EAL domain-containing protein (putative c-di-GMP-specific phosphodiesterase class I)/CheY-like chemotaxis protein
MENQEPGDAARPAAVARREIVPRVCIADAKQSTRTFIAEALEELGFTTCECRRVAELDAMLASNRPGLVVIGSSAGGIEACEMVELLAARQFGGKVLVIGPRVSPMVSAIRALGNKLGLAMLPLLPTPFGNADVRDRVAPLLPGEAPPAPPLDPSAPRRATRHELRYQPRIDTRGLALSGAEAIGGLRLGARASAQPGEFTPDGEDSGLVASALLVIARAVDDWRYFAARHGHVEIAVNLPAAFFHHPEAVDTLCRQMPDHPAFEGLIVEIDAADVIRDLELMKNVARRLRYRNIAVSIDRLGTEWPSLLGLHDLPFVELKVDPQFIAGCAGNRGRQATCRRILDLADAMGARTVADGVASRADFLAVREMGFHLAQGPLFARPMTAAELARALPGCDAMVPQ